MGIERVTRFWLALASALLLLAAPVVIAAQWTTNGNDVYKTNTAGNVGIGTTSPAAKVQVQQDVNGDNSIYVLNNGGGTLSRSLILFGEASSNAKYAYFGHFGANYVGSGPAQPRATLFVGADAGGFNLVSYGGASETGGKISFWTSPDAGGGGNAAVAERMRITSNGHVGIGTTSPAYKLQVRSGNGAGLFGDPTGTQLFYQIRPDAGKQGWLAFTEDAVADRWAIGIKNGDPKLYFSSGNIGTLTDRMNLDAAGNLAVGGNLTVSGNINAKYQDLAEWVPSSEQLSAGTVVVLDTNKSNQVIASGTAYDTRVAGVISAQPGITLGESGEGKVLVATTGRVRVKVDASRGAIQIGDLLVTSDVAGVAMKSEAVEFAGRKMHMPGTIIGKALEPLAKGSGEILVLLSLQ
ncbi:MAG TPA: hypothetical protein VFX97_03920 [Pyrinomonadaceae bacterium]|nr:hypothetical protein [Pyrinomonadaceae bacterium]